MSNSPLRIYGLEMTIDFPDKPYLAIKSRMDIKKDTHYKSWYEYGAAWNAVAYRFLSCTEHSNEFTNSINQVGFAPPQPERYKQEKELFGFFITGLATIESLCYGLFAIGSIIEPKKFPIKTHQDKKNIDLNNTKQKFKSLFTTDTITKDLMKIVDDQKFKDWNDIRNILVHRCLHGRSYNWNNEYHGKTLWLDIQIDEDTTVSRRDWLVRTLSELLEDMDTFTNSRL